MRILIHRNYKNSCIWAANYIVDQINKFGATPEKQFVLGLPTGSSPLGVYQELIEHVKQKRVTFRNVVTFNMDEYMGIAESHPQSYHYFMFENLFNHIDIPGENINILNGNAIDPEEECSRYEEKIKKAGGINLFLGGIGADGHIAFNEPGSSLKSKTRVKNLTNETIVANSRFFGGNISKVPKTALTVGIETIMAAREVILIVNGAGKAGALQKAVEEGVNHMWTASALQLHPKGIIVCDEDATLDLKVRTVRYFKDIEKHELDKFL